MAPKKAVANAGGSSSSSAIPDATIVVKGEMVVQMKGAISDAFAPKAGGQTKNAFNKMQNSAPAFALYKEIVKTASTAESTLASIGANATGDNLARAVFTNLKAVIADRVGAGEDTEAIMELFKNLVDMVDASKNEKKGREEKIEKLMTTVFQALGTNLSRDMIALIRVVLTADSNLLNALRVYGSLFNRVAEEVFKIQADQPPMAELVKSVSAKILHEHNNRVTITDKAEASKRKADAAEAAAEGEDDEGDEGEGDEGDEDVASTSNATSKSAFSNGFANSFSSSAGGGTTTSSNKKQKTSTASNSGNSTASGNSGGGSLTETLFGGDTQYVMNNNWEE